MANYLPGDRKTRKSTAAMIRVNHAGEYGAKRIYAGQLAVLKNTKSAPIIREMAAQEAHHLAAFERYIVERRVRPTALHPLWHVAGWALGAGTALMGEKAAMACTVAVESVITEHYDEQLEELGADEPQLKADIKQFRDEEEEHHDTGLANDAEQAPIYTAMTEAIKLGCRAAIGAAKRV